MSNNINNNFSSIEQMASMVLGKTASGTASDTDSKVSFQDILKEAQAQNISKSVTQSSELKFSRHANERLQSRNIDLSESQMERLENATKKAGEKGIQESLIMVDDLAFIVNIKNNTVITAVNDGDDKVFTNIDGAVIV